MNWGQKLVTFTVLFMVFIITLVVLISKQKTDLVDDNYYEKGILYQDEINKFAVDDSIERRISFDRQKGILQFATNVQGMNGVLYFCRPSNAAADFSVPFAVTSDGTFFYETTALSKGLWKVTFEWKLGGKLMASEKVIVVE